MPTPDEVEYQLNKLGIKIRLIGRGEISALPQLLRKNEDIQAIAVGVYEIGTAILVATKERLLFIDKRFYHCRCDEITYGSISSTDLETNLWRATVIILHRGGKIILRQVQNKQARSLVNYIDGKIENFDSNRP